MNKDFKSALENFAFDAACGRAIRHLYDIGMTAEEIEKRLDFPTPLSRIQSEIAAYEEQKEANGGISYRYERVYGKYGRTYLKRVSDEAGREDDKGGKETGGR